MPSNPALWYPKDLQSRPHANHRRTIRHPVFGYIDEIFCISCGCSQGAVNCDCPSIVSLCDECVGRFGGLPLPQLTDEENDRIGYQQQNH